MANPSSSRQPGHGIAPAPAIVNGDSAKNSRDETRDALQNGLAGGRIEASGGPAVPPPVGSSNSNRRTGSSPGRNRPGHHKIRDCDFGMRLLRCSGGGLLQNI